VPAGARRSCAIIAFRLMLGRLPVEQEDERRRRGQTLAQANDQDPADLADGEVCGIGHCHHSPSLIGLATAGQTYVSVTRSPTAHREAETAKAHRG